MNASDTLQRFIFEHAPIRGEIAHINQTYTSIMQQRPYPQMVKHLLGEALVSSLLLSGSLKFEGELSIQFQGDHRLPLILVQCDNQLNLRAYAKYEEALETTDYAEAFLSGKMVLNINQFKSTHTYQSIVPLTSTSMSENLMQYFAQSEQISTLVWLAINDEQAAGMILQLMPGQNNEQREQFWEYAVQLGQTVTEEELLGLTNETILHRLYHETELRLFEPRSIRFKCHCSKDKMMQVIKLLGKEDSLALIQEKGAIKINCEFCNSHYAFDAIDVDLMFRNP